MSDQPTQWPDGTERKRYQPLPGDVVDVDVRGIPALKIYGTRIGVVRRPTQAHGADLAWVTLPGYEHDELVEVDWLTLVHRKGSVP